MQNTLVRCRRQDLALKIGTMTVVLGLLGAFAAPQILDRAAEPSAQAAVPLFTPYRTAAVAEN